MKFLAVAEEMDAQASSKPLAVLMCELDGTRLSYIKKESTGSMDDTKNVLLGGYKNKRVISYTETDNVVVITLERGLPR